MILLEVIATAPEDCSAIEQAGGSRIELNSALELGGLTPSLGLIGEARQATRLPIMAMIRPRSGAFCYSAGEFAAMQRDVELALAHGADGVVFGCLTPEGTVDVPRVARLVQLAGAAQTVFHRAFDLTPDPAAALRTLIDLGITRVLTSGQAPSALEGAAVLAQCVALAAGRIEILPGGGIRAGNVGELIGLTGVNQVHASLSGWSHDTSGAARPSISFSAPGLAAASQVRVVDPAAVRQLRAVLNLLAGSS